MWAYTIRRLLYAVPILLGVSILVFALIHLAPGDVVDLLVPPKENNTLPLRERPHAGIRAGRL